MLILDEMGYFPLDQIAAHAQKVLRAWPCFPVVMHGFWSAQNEFIGIGTQGTPCGGAVMSAGNMSRCTGDNGDVDLPAFGVLFVR
mgnify:CR=1 FL=1